jgi:prophage regulatory protein
MHLAAVKPNSLPQTALAPRLLRLPFVEERTGLKKSTIYALMRAHQFPQCVLVGARSVAWRAAEVDAWCESRPTKEGGAA